MIVVNFLKALRDSADIQYSIFTKGSCFKLYEILKVLFPDAKAYWSDRDGHCITEIAGDFYDIGGKVTKDYVENEGYYVIPEDQLHGYSLMKWLRDKENHSVSVSKYKIEQS